MPQNPYRSQIIKEEQLVSDEVSRRLTAAVQAPAVQKKADALTNASTAKPPREVLAVFDKALETALKKAAARYRGMQIDATPSYTMKKAQWIGTVWATVRFPMQTLGGGEHVVKPGETLWGVSEKVYGSGAYWTVLADANKPGVKSGGNFILAGYPLKLPKIQVVAGQSVAPRAIGRASPGKAAVKKARPVAYPTLEYDLEQGSTVKSIIKSPGFTVIISTSLKGKLKASKPGILPGGFNLRTFEGEVKAAGKYFESSVKIKKFKPTEIVVGSNVSGSLWKTTISITQTGAIKSTLSPRPVAFKSKGVTFEGNVGFEIEMQIIPDMKRVPAPKSLFDVVSEWARENGKVLIGGALVVGAGAIIVATIGEDILTAGAGIADDPVSFAAAAAMFQRGLVMIR